MGHDAAANGQSTDSLLSCEVPSCLGRLCCCAGGQAGIWQAGQAGWECQRQLCLLLSRDGERRAHMQRGCSLCEVFTRHNAVFLWRLVSNKGSLLLCRDGGGGEGVPNASAASDEVLRLQYSMAVVRLVNGIADSSQKGRVAASVAGHAAQAGKSFRIRNSARPCASRAELRGVPATVFVNAMVTLHTLGAWWRCTGRQAAL